MNHAKRIHRVPALLVLVWGLAGAVPLRADESFWTNNIPVSHPRIWWTADRLARAQAWFAANPFTPATVNTAERAMESAFHYVLTGNAASARNAINYAMGITCGTVGVASDCTRWDGEGVALVYDWCHSQMTPAERDTLFTRWNGYVDHWRQQDWGGVPQSQSNYYWGYLRNQMLWSVATWWENQPLATTLLEDAVVTRFHDDFLQDFMPAHGVGGLSHEGSNYGGTVFAYPLFPFTNAADLGRNLFEETNYYKEGVFYLIYATPPGSTIQVNGGSSDWNMFPFADDERFLEQGFLRNATWGNFMAAASDRWSSLPVGQYARRWLSTVGNTPDRLFRAADHGGAERSFTSLPLDYYLAGSKFFYGRTAWSTPATAFHLQLAQTADEGHGHLDYGNWQLWRNNRWMVRETVGYSNTIAGLGGTGTVDNREAVGHNTLLMNDKAFADHWPNGNAVVKRIESRPDYAYAVTDLTPLYRNDQADDSRKAQFDNPSVSRIEREFLFIRPLETMVILDRMDANAVGATPATGIVKTFVAHFEQAPTLSGNSALSVNGTQAVRLTTLSPAGPTMRLVAEGGGVGQNRLEVRVSGERLTHFINVLQCRDASGQDLALSLSETPSTLTVTLTHPTRGQAVVEFQKGAATAGGRFGFSASGPVSAMTPLLDRVQTIRVTDQEGVVWETPGAPADSMPPARPRGLRRR